MDMDNTCTVPTFHSYKMDQVYILSTIRSCSVKHTHMFSAFHRNDKNHENMLLLICHFMVRDSSVVRLFCGWGGQIRASRSRTSEEPDP